MSDQPDDLTNAIQKHQEGHLEEVIPFYREHLACQPEDAQVIYLLGTALLQVGEAKESIEYLKKAEAKFPHIPDVSNNLGIAYQSIGEWEQAESSFRRSIQINPDYGQAYFNFGSLLYERNRLEEAEELLKHAVRLSPGDCEVTAKYADLFKDQGKWIEAAQAYHSMIQLPQMSLNSMINYAYVLVKQNRIDEALEIYARVLTRKPDYHQVYSSIGFLLERQGKLQEALSFVEKALEIEPGYADGWNNRGVILKSLYQFDEAETCFQKALSLNPDFPLAEYNLGTLYLIQKQYEKGWKGFSAHLKLNEVVDEHHRIPLWDGTPIPDKRLLVYVDQGMGDAMMLIRFLDQVKSLSQATLLIEVPKALLELFRNSFPQYEFLEEGHQQDSFDFRLPLSLCPVLLNLKYEDLPYKNRYLKTSGSADSKWEQVLNQGEKGRRKIGLCWQGNPDQSRDHVRSCPLLLLEPLLDLSGMDWFSFQVDPVSRNQLEESGLGEKVTDLGEMLPTFQETSEALARMDLVITVDTSLAHLAGAIGIPTWTMLCHLPDWRWHLEIQESPWYPEMKLYRQPRWGDWNSLITTIKNDLSNGS